MKKINSFKPALVVLLLIFGFQIRSSAQSVWIDEGERTSKVGIEAMIPSLSDFNSDVDFPTSAVVLYGQIRANDRLSIKIDLPVSHLSVGDSDISETDIGNPYIGIAIFNKESSVLFDLGFRLPLAPSFNISDPGNNAGLFTGVLVENYNLGKYVPETFSITSQIKYRWQNPAGLIVKFGGGPDLIFPPDDADAELFLNYHSQFLFSTGDFRIGAGFTGLLFISENDISFGDRTIHDLGILSVYDFGPIEAEAYLRVPLDDEIRNDLNFVLGLNLLFSL